MIYYNKESYNTHLHVTINKTLIYLVHPPNNTICVIYDMHIII